MLGNVVHLLLLKQCYVGNIVHLLLPCILSEPGLGVGHRFLLVLLYCLLQQSLIRTIFHFCSFSTHLTKLKISIHIISYCIQGGPLSCPTLRHPVAQRTGGNNAGECAFIIATAIVWNAIPTTHDILNHLEIVQGCIKNSPIHHDLHRLNGR